MGKFVIIVAAMLGVSIIGGAAFLTVWDIPAPTAQEVHVIPDAKFPR
jgi:hypothetical protein